MIFNTQPFLSFCSFLNTLQARAQANYGSVKIGCNQDSGFWKVCPGGEFDCFYWEEGHKATAVRAALLTVMSYSVIVRDAQLSAWMLKAS